MKKKLVLNLLLSNELTDKISQDNWNFKGKLRLVYVAYLIYYSTNLNIEITYRLLRKFDVHIIIGDFEGRDSLLFELYKKFVYMPSQNRS